MEHFVLTVMLWISLSFGWQMVEPPKAILPLSEHPQAEEYMPYARGIYGHRADTIWIMDEQFKTLRTLEECTPCIEKVEQSEASGTLVHELIHNFQDQQGRMEEYQNATTHNKCDNTYRNEREAYMLENIWRKEHGVQETEFEFDLMIQYQGCLGYELSTLQY